MSIKEFRELLELDNRKLLYRIKEQQAILKTAKMGLNKITYGNDKFFTTEFKKAQHTLQKLQFIVKLRMVLI